MTALQARTIAAIAVVTLLFSCDSRRPSDEFSTDTTPAQPTVAEPARTAPSPSPGANGVAPGAHMDILEATELPEDFELMFNHNGSCLRCIDYRVHMYADGRAEFRNTESEISHPEVGAVVLPAVEAQRTIDKQTMLGLAKELARIGFLDIKQDELDEPCKLAEGHRPLVTFKLTWNGRSNIIKHDHRCNVGEMTDLQIALLNVERRLRVQAKLGDYLTKLRETAVEKVREQNE